MNKLRRFLFVGVVTAFLSALPVGTASAAGCPDPDYPCDIQPLDPVCIIKKTC